MRHLFKFMIFASIINAQKSIQSNTIFENKIGFDAGIYANIGNSGLEFDGYFEIQTRKGLFIETSGITQISENNTIFNTSMGIMNEITSRMIIGGGYSNYLEINNEMLHEIFFGASSSLLTGVVFLELKSNFSPNYIGTINLNKLFPSLSFNADIMTIISNELDQVGCDLFMNFSKTFESGFTAGYIFSSERYEDTEERKYNKDGYSKQIMLPVVSQGFFNTVFIGWDF